MKNQDIETAVTPAMLETLSEKIEDFLMQEQHGDPEVHRLSLLCLPKIPSGIKKKVSANLNIPASGLEKYLKRTGMLSL